MKRNRGRYSAYEAVNHLFPSVIFKINLFSTMCLKLNRPPSLTYQSLIVSKRFARNTNEMGILVMEIVIVLHSLGKN